MNCVRLYGWCVRQEIRHRASAFREKNKSCKSQSVLIGSDDLNLFWRERFDKNSVPVSLWWRVFAEKKWDFVTEILMPVSQFFLWRSRTAEAEARHVCDKQNLRLRVIQWVCIVQFQLLISWLADSFHPNARLVNLDDLVENYREDLCQQY